MGMLSHARKKKARQLGLTENNLGFKNKGRGRQKLRKQRQEADMEAAAQAIEKKYSKLKGAGTAPTPKKKRVRQRTQKKKTAKTKSEQKVGVVIEESVKHEVQVCDQTKKASVLMGFLLRVYENVKKSQPQVLISVSKKDDLTRLVQFLQSEAVQAALSKPTLASLHDAVSADERKTVVADFWMGKTVILITTDSIFQSVRTPSHLVNFDFPPSMAEYLQRSNRVGKSGRAGAMFSLFTAENVPVAPPLIRFLHSIQQPISRELLDLTIEHLENKLLTPVAATPTSSRRAKKRARVEVTEQQK